MNKNKSYTEGYKKGTEDEIMFIEHFIKTSKDRGKTIDILMEDVNSEKMIGWLSELYDLRREVQELKNNPFKKIVEDSQGLSFKAWAKKYPNFKKWLDDNGFVYNYKKDKHKGKVK
jgi:hypothetical protein